MSSSSATNRVRARTVVVVIELVATVLALMACSEGPGGQRVENQPPTVWLSSAPPEGNDSRYRIHLYWGGWDPDGDISHYEYAITTNETGVFDPADTVTTEGHNPWHPVYASDSVFTFTADVLRDTLTTRMVTRFERSHTFFIRAVDEQGLASPEPAYRSFTAWTLSPKVSIRVPGRASANMTPSQVPSIATYRWVAEDYVNSTLETQDPDSVRWILYPVVNNDFVSGINYIRRNPCSKEWSAWHYYGAPDGSGKSWTTPPTDLGAYVFAVQAKDEAGAVTPVFDEAYNVRRVRVSGRATGPVLQVSNEFTGPIVTSVENTPTVIVDLPAGIPLQFTIQANAEDYGGLVSGYRYGWDITDVSDPEQWETDFTPFTSDRARTQPPRTFYFGTHTFDAEVIDNNGARSRVEVKINVFQFSMTRSLLFVDDFNLVSDGIDQTNGAVPSDAEHDAFWQEMLAGVAGFSWDDDVITVRGGQSLSIVRFADYQTVVWDAFGGYNTTATARPLLYDLIRFRPKTGGTSGSAGKVQPNVLSMFMRAGGHLLLCGLQPLSQVPNVSTVANRYPLIFKYELSGDQDGNYADQIQSGNAVGDQSFAYFDACVNTLDIAYTSTSLIRNRQNNGCGAETLRRVDPKNDGMREALPIDPAFPLLQLRPEVAGNGRAFAPGLKGWNAELYNPPYFDLCNVAEQSPRRPCFEPFYGQGCLNTASAIYNAPVAFWGGTYRYVEPEEGGGIPARSAFLGFEPYYFNPAQVKQMMNVILFDEWQLPQL